MPSDGERFNTMCHSTNEIAKLGESIRNDYRYGRLKGLCAKLWYGLLCNKGTGDFWLFGGELDNEFMPEGGLVAAAFNCHVPEGHAYGGPTEHGFIDYVNIARDMCEIDDFLDGDERHVFKIYSHTENCAYALTKYKDEFMEQFERFNMALRNIQGECFNIFTEERVFVDAWMYHHIAMKLITYQDDLVNQWWYAQNMHHDIKGRKLEYEELYKLYKEVQFRIPSLMERLEITLRLAGGSYHYKHNHKKLLEMIERHNSTNEEKIDIEYVGVLLEECNKQHKEAEEFNQRQYAQSKYCAFTNQSGQES